MNKVSDISISDNSFISLHVQLHNQLRHLILSGRWASGSRIPSENEITSHLKISRSTVRLAFQQAEIEGLIERAAGRGTFVAQLISKDIKRRLIAFLTCSFDAENHLLMLNGAEQEGRARGYQIVFSNAKNQEEEFEILQRLKDEDIAGILLWANARASQSQEPNVIRYQQVKVPIVLMDRTIYGLDRDCVTSDNYGGAQALMRHLVDLGHQNIVFLSHFEMEILPVMERYRAYCDVLAESGLSSIEPWIIGQPGIEVSASHALQSSLNPKNPILQQIRNYMSNAQPRPTAIFAVNDYLAVLASRAMKQLELRIPDVVSIAGFDDTDLAAHLEVPLTTVAQDPFTIGKRAAQRLIDRIEGDAGDTIIELIPTELRIRSSTSIPVHV
jgi:GntR family transcriptional regulator, arabinose operon transcriptional repressor